MRRIIVTVGLVCSLVGCNSGGPTQLDSPAALQEYFWDYCLSLANIFTSLAESISGANAFAAPVNCPEGGTAAYDDAAGVVQLDNCGGYGSTVTGTINATISVAGTDGQATITGGDIIITGAAEGEAVISGGTMSWVIPVDDATTYWELNIVLDGTTTCIWSGAEVGPCPSL